MGASRAGEGIKVLKARPVSPRAFAFKLANTGGLDQRVTVATACRKVRVAARKGPFLKLAARHHLTVRVAPFSSRQAGFTCPSGTVPAATGFDLGRRTLTLRQQTQDLHVVTFAAFNAGATVRTASFYVGCVTVVHPAGTRAAQLQVSLATDTVPLRTGSQVVTRLCPSGWLALAAGYTVPGGVELNGAAAVGRTGRWSLTNPAQKPVLAQVQLACARVS